MGSVHQIKRSDNKWYTLEVRWNIFIENLTYFFIPWSGRKYSHTNSYNSAMTVIAQDDHLTAGAWAACEHTQKLKGHERLLPFVTTYHLAVKNLKQTLEQWRLIHNQPFLKTNFTKPSITFYKKKKRKISLRHARESKKYNLKAVMRNDHESHMGSPCWSIFTFILTSCRCDVSLVSTFISSLLPILLRRKTYF